LFLELEGCITVRGTEPNAAAAAELRKEWHFWIQMFTGSSWPNIESQTSQHCVAFSLAATVHSLLNTGAGLGVLWLVIRVLTARRRSMELARLIALRDNSLKAQLQSIVLENSPPSQFEEQASKVDRIFADANLRLKNSLAVVVGAPEAERLMKSLAQAEF
jgi:hypothetical protein